MLPRILPLLLCSFAIVGCGLREYTATATLQIVEPEYHDHGEIRNSCPLPSATNVNTHANILRSRAILEAVALNLADQSADLLAPYAGNRDALTLFELLEENQSIEVDQTSRQLKVSFKHPSPESAALVANQFAETLITYTIQLRQSTSSKAVEDLGKRAEQQLERIQIERNRLTEFKEQHPFDMGDLDAIEHTGINKLKALIKQQANSPEPTDALAQAISIQETKLVELSKIRVNYNSLLRSLEVQESFYEALKNRENEEREALVYGIQPDAVIIERATVNS